MAQQGDIGVGELRNYPQAHLPGTVRAHLDVTGDAVALPPELSEELYLVVREAIRNALHHAETGEVFVTVAVTQKAVTTTIAGNGHRSKSAVVTSSGALARTPATVRLPVPQQDVERLGRPQPEDQPRPLTGRELDILRLTAQALSNAQVAARLHITEATVKRHLTNIYGKLGAVSRLDAVRKASAAKLIDVEHWRSSS